MNGYSQIISIKNGENYVPIGCIQSDSFSEDIDVSESVLGSDGWTTDRLGLQGYNINFTGIQTYNTPTNLFDTVNSDVLSYQSLLSLKRNRTLISWKSSNFDLSYEQTGKGYISSISENAPTSDFLTFECTIQGYGKPIILMVDIITFDSSKTWDSKQIYF